MPRMVRKSGGPVRVGLKNNPALRRSASRESGVMIVPPTPESQAQIRAEMKRVREELRDSIGQEAYNKRMQEANTFFKDISDQGVRS